MKTETIVKCECGKDIIHIEEECALCGNVSGYDKQSLKANTHNINGCNVVLCCPCEDDLLQKLARGRGINITYGDGGEISKVKLKSGVRLIHPNMNKISEVLNENLLSEEVETILSLIEWC
jgi:hypothetical protein